MFKSFNGFPVLVKFTIHHCDVHGSLYHIGGIFELLVIHQGLVVVFKCQVKIALNVKENA